MVRFRDVSTIAVHRQIRREMRSFAAADYTVSRCSLSECWREAAALLLNIQEKYGHQPTLEQMERTLENQSRHLDEHSIVLRLTARGAPVGFALFYLRSVAPTDDYTDKITRRPVAAN